MDGAHFFHMVRVGYDMCALQSHLGADYHQGGGQDGEHHREHHQLLGHCLTLHLEEIQMLKAIDLPLVALKQYTSIESSSISISI